MIGEPRYAGAPRRIGIMLSASRATDSGAALRARAISALRFAFVCPLNQLDRLAIRIGNPDRQSIPRAPFLRESHGQEKEEARPWQPRSRKIARERLIMGARKVGIV